MGDSSNTAPREPARSGAEQDVVTNWRRLYTWTKRPGSTSWTKRQIRRRERRQSKQENHEMPEM